MARIPFWIANEEFEDEEVEFPELVEMPSETIEAQELESIDEVNESDDLMDDGEELSEDIDQAEALRDTVEDSDNVSDTAAAVVDIAVESFCAKWGVTPIKIATESRGNNKRTAIVALESAIGDLWARFIAFISELINKIKDGWVRFHNAGKSLQKRGAKLSTAVGTKITGTASPKNDKLTKRTWMKGLVIDRKVDLKKCLFYANSSDSMVTKAASSIGELLDSTGKIINTEEKLDAIGAHVEPTAGLWEKVCKGFFDTRMYVLTMEYISHPPKDATNVLVSDLPGYCVFTSYQLGGQSAFEKDAYPITYSRFEVIQEGNAADSWSIPTANKSVMEECIAAIKVLGVNMEKDLSNFRAYDQKLAGLKSVLKTKQGKPEIDPKANWDLKWARQQVLNCTNLNAAVNHARSALAKGLVGYVTDSLKEYA